VSKYLEIQHVGNTSIHKCAQTYLFHSAISPSYEMWMWHKYGKTKCDFVGNL